MPNDPKTPVTQMPPVTQTRPDGVASGEAPTADFPATFTRAALQARLRGLITDTLAQPVQTLGQALMDLLDDPALRLSVDDVAVPTAPVLLPAGGFGEAFPTAWTGQRAWLKGETVNAAGEAGAHDDLGRLLQRRYADHLAGLCDFHEGQFGTLPERRRTLVGSYLKMFGGNRPLSLPALTLRTRAGETLTGDLHGDWAQDDD